MVDPIDDCCQRCGGFDCPGDCPPYRRVDNTGYWYQVLDGGEDICAPCAVTDVAMMALNWEQLAPTYPANIRPGPDEDVLCCKCGCLIQAGSLESEEDGG